MRRDLVHLLYGMLVVGILLFTHRFSCWSGYQNGLAEHAMRMDAIVTLEDEAQGDECTDADGALGESPADAQQDDSADERA